MGMTETDLLLLHNVDDMLAEALAHLGDVSEAVWQTPAWLSLQDARQRISRAQGTLEGICDAYAKHRGTHA